jgi:hypothetical protein
MKKGENKIYVDKINESLSKYDTMPIFQKKVDLANDFLAKHPPVEAINAMKNKRIKRYFEEGNSLEQIAVLVKLSEKEVSARLQELGLVETNACV